MTKELEDIELPPMLDARKRRPLTREQQARVDAAMAKPAAAKQDASTVAFLEKQKAETARKREIAKARKAAPSPSTAMPLVGKAAIAAIEGGARMKVGPREEKLRAMRAGTSAGASAAAKSAPTKSAKPKESTMDASTETTTAKKPKAPAKPKAVKTKKAKAKTPAAKPRKPAARAKGAAREKADGVRPGTKLALVVDLLKRTEGCTTKDILTACDWPSVSVPQQAKAAGLTLRKVKEGSVTRYFAE